MTTYRGSIKAILFHNKADNFGTLSFAIDGYEDDPIRAVGILVDPQKGARLEIDGEWVSHPKHGAQFKINRFSFLKPESIEKQVVFLGDDALGAYETLKRDLNPSVALYSSVKGVSNLFWLASWTVILLGFPLLFRPQNWQLWFGLLFLPLLYQWVIDSVFESGPRHHVPYVALIAVLVGMVLSLAVQPDPKSTQ